jgi:uncharacterized membrane protein YfcA
MPATEVAALTLLILAAAALYSSVGHAGASGYLAAMAILGVAPTVMKPTALVLNILVAIIASVRFHRAGYFSWSTFWPFAVGSIPLAFVGGALQLPGAVYKYIVGITLLLAAVQLARSTLRQPAPLAGAHSPPPLLPAVALGGLIGLLSGLVGVGGGIFLSPLLLFKHWADVRTTSAVSAVFILVNSLSGLTGNLASVRFLPDSIPLWAGAAAIGGLLGSELGSRRLATTTLRRLLSLVLVIAGLKLMFL